MDAEELLDVFRKGPERFAAFMNKLDNRVQERTAAAPSALRSAFHAEEDPAINGNVDDETELGFIRRGGVGGAKDPASDGELEGKYQALYSL